MDKNYAYISINGIEDVSSVTAALGLEPTKSWNAGDKGEDGAVYNFSHWEYMHPDFEEDYLDDALEEVLDFIEEKQLDLSSVPEGFEVLISCAGHHEKESPSFLLTNGIILRLAQLGVGVDFDLYCHAEKS